MSEISRLLSTLKNNGITINNEIESALLKVSVEDFTDFDCTDFYLDRPVLFFEDENGNCKTISAPHMIISMIDNLELSEGSNVVVYGGKGGFVSAIIAHIIGEEGNVTIIDPNQDIVDHINNRLAMYPTVSCLTTSEIIENDFLNDVNRLLVTGQIEKIPDWIEGKITPGGFVLAPIGNTVSQRLLKIENQGSEFYETDLGGVVFGPVDIHETLIGIPSPEELATMIEQLVEIFFEMEIIQEDEKLRLYDLVAELRQLPDDLIPPEDMEDPTSHPMVKLMIEEGEWFVKLWPLIKSITTESIASFGDDSSHIGGNFHKDFTP